MIWNIKEMPESAIDVLMHSYVLLFIQDLHLSIVFNSITHVSTNYSVVDHQRSV